MMTDTIADMITRIRNSNMIGRREVSMRSSKMRVAIAKVLKSEGYLSDFDVVSGKPSSTLRLTLNISKNGEAAINEIKRASKPGRRVYRAVDAIKPVRNGMGIAVISTSRGVLSDKEAIRLKVGGEILFTVE